MPPARLGPPHPRPPKPPCPPPQQDHLACCGKPSARRQPILQQLCGAAKWGPRCAGVVWGHAAVMGLRRRPAGAPSLPGSRWEAYSGGRGVHRGAYAGQPTGVGGARGPAGRHGGGHGAGRRSSSLGHRPGRRAPARHCQCVTASGWRSGGRQPRRQRPRPPWGGKGGAGIRVWQGGAGLGGVGGEGGRVRRPRPRPRLRKALRSARAHAVGRRPPSAGRPAAHFMRSRVASDARCWSSSFSAASVTISTISWGEIWGRLFLGGWGLGGWGWGGARARRRGVRGVELNCRGAGRAAG
jgi:hypothetical protein